MKSTENTKKKPKQILRILTQKNNPKTENPENTEN